ncbi:MAG TPA: hypothetical protein VH186_38305 [Chloroflexia bacterium]|nr:hypothetical protein [Chloroflexia bacterium]
MGNKRFLPVLPEGLNSFEQSLMTGDPELRGQTPEGIRDLQLVYRREQARQLCQDLQKMGLNPEELEYYEADFEKNLCPSTGLESESGILYNKRTGVSVPVVLEWVCQWSCTRLQWYGEYEPKLETCQPVYFFNQITDQDIEALK